MATTIRILPENLTNKIAAGEVVERPASVAKELVENALDAGAREVVVEIESGGRRLIKVSDTGCGMSKEDALLSIERHATSKIACDDDLFSLSTLGFRGEALPSIASVSRLTIATRTADNVEGTEIYAEGGRIKEVKGCGMAAGTEISVRNLFFNTPARLKFMKSAETEGGHVGELLTRLAISRPDVRFTYMNDGKVVFKALDAKLGERVATMLGRPIAASLYPVSYEDATGLKVTGLVAAPECSRSAGSHLYTYINGRFIRDKVVQHAILQAYRNFLERGRYPVVALFIEISPGEVDVNVHPTKHEVRFREQGRVHDAIQHAVESVLKATPWLKGTEARGAVGQQARTPLQTTASPVKSGTSLATDSKQVAEVGAAAARSTADVSSDVSAAKVAEVRELLVNYQPRTQQVARPQFQQPSLLQEGRSGGISATGSSRDAGRAAATNVLRRGGPHPDPLPEGEGIGGAGGTGCRAGDGAVRAATGQPISAAAGEGSRAATGEGTRAVAGQGAGLVIPKAGGGDGPGTADGPAAGSSGYNGTVAAEVEPASALNGEVGAVDGGVAGHPASAEGTQPAEVTAGDDENEEPGYFSSLSVIGQFNASYILCQRGTELILIDQHAAHERVAFEKLKREFAAREVDSQGLLFPETMELSFREAAVLAEHLDGMTALGFELEEFGGKTWLLKGVPQVLAGTDYLRTIRDILEELGSLGRSRTFTDIQEDILARLACHSVVRGRRTLTQQEITALFAQMDRTDFSSNCPHGRPVMQSLTLAEIEKMFKRV